jgi:formamidopyrimidine-DNA glycosylase
MPEGIEVKILTECLNTIITGKKINNISFISGRYIKHGVPDGFKAFEKVLPLKIISVGCKGKFIYFTLEGGWYIFNTLGLSGSWEFKKDTHTRAIIQLGENYNIYFSDMRNFGTFKFINDSKILQKKIDTLGLDIFNPAEFN